MHEPMQLARPSNVCRTRKTRARDFLRNVLFVGSDAGVIAVLRVGVMLDMQANQSFEDPRIPYALSFR